MRANTTKDSAPEHKRTISIHGLQFHHSGEAVNGYNSAK